MKWMAERDSKKQKARGLFASTQLRGRSPCCSGRAALPLARLAALTTRAAFTPLLWQAEEALRANKEKIMRLTREESNMKKQREEALKKRKEEEERARAQAVAQIVSAAQEPELDGPEATKGQYTYEQLVHFSERAVMRKKGIRRAAAAAGRRGSAGGVGGDPRWGLVSPRGSGADGAGAPPPLRAQGERSGVVPVRPGIPDCLW